MGSKARRRAERRAVAIPLHLTWETQLMIKLGSYLQYRNDGYSVFCGVLFFGCF